MPRLPAPRQEDMRMNGDRGDPPSRGNDRFDAGQATEARSRSGRASTRRVPASASSCLHTQEQVDNLPEPSLGEMPLIQSHLPRP
jgi:hypothetical protein